jgi:tRNA threonylcarbamoyladenosine biosynthesis protein TsaB
MMNILALDTCMAACSVAAQREGGRVASRFEARERGHAEALFAMIEAVMAEAGLAYSELSRIAVTLGPGSFTGVRAGVAAARGLAAATKAGTVGMLSLDVLAERCLVQTDAAARRGGFAVAHDARRGEVYVALYSASGARISEPQALAPETAARLLPHGIGFVAGTGAKQVAVAAAAFGRSTPTFFETLQPDAADLLHLALNVEASGKPLSPIYLRPPGAEPQDGKMLMRKENSAL